MDILISGATGFIGSELTRFFLQQNDTQYSPRYIYIAIRSQSQSSVEDRWEKLKNNWSKFFDISKYNFNKIKLIDYDFLQSRPDLIERLNKEAQIEYFFHCAALTNLNLDYKEAYQGNVVTTKFAIELAYALKNLKRFIFYSTAFVSGKKKGIIKENDKNILKFNNTYEQTKYQAELLVKESSISYTILRPVVIVGDSRTGYVKGTKVIYAIFKLWVSKFLKKAPIDKKGRGDIIPIDFIIKSSVYLSQKDQAVNQIYHLSMGSSIPLGMDIFNAGIKTFNLPPPSIAPRLIVPIIVHPWFLRFVPYNLRSVIMQLKFFLPYLNSRNRFYSIDKLQKDLKGSGIDIPRFDEFKDNIFRFVKDSFWGKKELKNKIV